MSIHLTCKQSPSNRTYYDQLNIYRKKEPRKNNVFEATICLGTTSISEKIVDEPVNYAKAWLLIKVEKLASDTISRKIKDLHHAGLLLIMSLLFASRSK